MKIISTDMPGVGLGVLKIEGYYDIGGFSVSLTKEKAFKGLVLSTPIEVSKTRREGTAIINCIKECDGALIVGEIFRHSKLTFDLLNRLRKPLYVIPIGLIRLVGELGEGSISECVFNELDGFLLSNKIKTLFVTGLLKRDLLAAEVAFTRFFNYYLIYSSIFKKESK